jgi:transcriptional regulator GlxA family with amidase domain
MNGTEVDQLISDVLAREARAIELARRADCKRRELSARIFLAETKSRE